MPKNLLSFVIPAYNEESTIEELIRKVQQVEYNTYKTELIIVDDASRDNTNTITKKLQKEFSNIRIFRNERNMGKSQTVRKGIIESRGDLVIIQDADLEYDPEDIPPMITYLEKYECDAAYGNRFGVDNGVVYLQNFIGNLCISFISNIFTMRKFRAYIPDMEVCYKLVRGDLMREIGKTISSQSNFGFEPEVTAKLAKRNAKMVVVPIRYYPRTVEEGKKMHAFRDGIKALFEIIHYNLFS